ncbi:SCO2523 family variant P-loop protein [Streptomyces capoamus]|uniref:SCO2523 family variant P-loop protein n=1 Tax=Streptomyces capoamus TaxID=68183 RepID=UPI00339B0DCD
MLVLAASDKGGTGRSVTAANLAYQRSLDGDDVCFLDFDFGSPTASAVFDLPDAVVGADGRGLHSYLQGRTSEPLRIDVWARTEHPALRDRPSGSGRLVLLPGDRTGGEFPFAEADRHRFVDLVLRLRHEFDLLFVDLSAGRSYAADLVLTATSPHGGLGRQENRWLVFHRWTRQHVMAAAELAYGNAGLVRAGAAMGHRPEVLSGSIRFVRAAAPDLESPPWSQVSPAQYVWLRQCERVLEELAAARGICKARVLASIPLEPVLQWQERLITDEDVHDHGIAHHETLRAMRDLAQRLTDDEFWGPW